MDGKSVSDSAYVNCNLSLDFNETNLDDSGFENKLLSVAQTLAMKVAKTHTNSHCSILRIDSMQFFKKINLGDYLVGYASINRTWSTTMEIGIKIVAEDFRTLEQKIILTGYFTFVAVNEDSQPVLIPPVIPETAEQVQRYLDAERRHQHQKEEDELNLFDCIPSGN